MAKNCFILSQKVPKFELYKHNDELFNIYYGILYELWTFAYFDRLCKLEKRGMKLKKILSSETSNGYFIKVWFQLSNSQVPDKKTFMWIFHRVLC
jgi:hypothetical protein